MSDISGQNNGRHDYKTVQIGPRAVKISENWEIKRIDNLTENLDSKRKPIKSSERKKGDVPYYGATGKIDSVAHHLFDEELVLVGEDGADWSPFGGTAYLISGKSWVNNHVHVLRCCNIESEFLTNYLDYIDMRYIISGTNRGKLNQSELNKFLVPLPPPGEQRRIAEILSTVDELIHQTDAIIEETEELKRGLMQDLFRPKVSGDINSTKLGNIPENWEIGSLQSYEVDFILGGTPSRDSDEYFDGTVPWLKTGEIQNNNIVDAEEYITSLGLSQSSAKLLPEGSVLVAMYGATAGNIGLLQFEAATNQACCAVISDNSDLSNKFLYYQLLFENPRLKSYSVGSGQQNLSKGLIQTFDILVPPLEEQQRIARILSKVDEKLTTERETKRFLQELKRGLMQDLLTGKVRVGVET